MRRYAVRHENRVLPFVVSDSCVYAAAFPQIVAQKSYTWNAAADSEGDVRLEIDGISHTARCVLAGDVALLEIDGFFYRLPFTNLPGASQAAAAARSVRAEIPGRIVRVLVRPGDTVKQNQALIVQEAMKMELTLRAPGDAVVAAVHVSEGAQVEAECLLVTWLSAESGQRG